MGSNEDLVITSLTGKHSDLPVIDFAQWSLDCTSEERYVIGKSLADACHYVGFVYIVNHGVAAELIDEAFEWSRKLFGLRSERKMLAPHPPGPEVHRGYSYPGLEKVSQVMVSSDPGMGDKLREVKDCKVCFLRCVTRNALRMSRRAMRSVVKRMKSSQISGYQKMFCRDTKSS